jgi:hypothetical protein
MKPWEEYKSYASYPPNFYPESGVCNDRNPNRDVKKFEKESETLRLFSASPLSCPTQ